MALGKSIGEIRALPYPEYTNWQRFYALEPWGWHNEEYRLAAMLAMFYNVNKDKKKKAKTANDFMRDMLDAIDKAIKQKRQEMDYENMTWEEKRKFVLGKAGTIFGSKKGKL